MRRRRTRMISTKTFSFDGEIIREGDEIGGDHPMLETHAGYFVPAGTPRSEWPTPELRLPRDEPKPAPSGRVMVATRTFLHPAGHVVMVTTKGDRVREGHMLTRLYPDRFQPEDAEG
jgi:hypothetical protein